MCVCVCVCQTLKICEIQGLEQILLEGSGRKLVVCRNIELFDLATYCLMQNVPNSSALNSSFLYC